MALIPSQQIAKEAILSLIRAGNKRINLLGSAGTGKTFMVDELITDLKSEENYKYGGIYITAPTHKALKVLKTKISAEGKEDYLHFATLHSGMQLKRTIDFTTGKESYKRGKVNPKFPPFGFATQLVAVDEASMVGLGLMDGEGKIEDFPNITFLFIGDAKQLPPVGETISPIFNRGYPEVVLTEIVRQKSGSPIIELSNNLSLIRSGISDINEIGHGYFFEQGKLKIIDNLAQANGTDEIKYLAYTNVEVNTTNSEVRNLIYGTPKRVELGESLIFDAPYKGLNTDFKNNDEVKVEEIEMVRKSFVIPDGRTRFGYNSKGELRLQSGIGTYETFTLDTYLVNEDFYVLTEESDEMFNSVLKKVKSERTKGIIDWGAVFWFQEQIAQVKYNHALTVHKSQGSTFGTAIVNVGNIDFNKSATEKQAMLYTAVTRASSNVALYNVRRR